MVCTNKDYVCIITYTNELLKGEGKISSTANVNIYFRVYCPDSHGVTNLACTL